MTAAADPPSTTTTTASPSQQQQHPHHIVPQLHHDRQKHHTKAEGMLEYNIFRDSALRYLGYANELGESFRYQLPRLVKPSYVVAFGYCLADASTSGWQAYNQPQYHQNDNNNHNNNKSAAQLDAVVASVDTLLWQSLASVAIPGLVIHQIVKWSRFFIQQNQQQHKMPSASAASKNPAFIVTWGPTVLGLASIPLIIKPIDEFVDELMEHTFRKIDWTNFASQSPNQK
jgi:mitochondrial fission process protein 1